MDKGKLFVFSAPSGAGKTTIVRRTLKNFPELVFSISATTRNRREKEIDGKDYFFIAEEDFKSKVEKNEFVEWEQFYGYHYGTLKSFVDDTLASGNDLVLEVDVKGALNIKKCYPEAIMIFIKPPSLEVLKKRLVDRQTETEEDLKKRFARMEMELQHENYFDYVVVNDELERAVEEVKNIINILNREV